MARTPIVTLEVVNYKQELARIEKEVVALANVEIEDRIDYATQQLAIVTPVKTGKARRGWQSDNVKDIDGYSGAVIVNDVEYISYLNNGSSKQAPAYFIEQVLIRIGILS